MFSPDISVVVLSYSRPRLLEQALRSLLAQSVRLRELIVVDNPSGESAAVRQVIAAIPDVALIVPDRNLGFAAGMNLGLATATGKLVLITEDDILLDRRCVEHLADCLAGRADAGLVAPVMYDFEAGTVRCAGGAVHLGTVYRPEVSREQPEEGKGPASVGFVPGAILLGRTRELRALGGFREEFFMYSEDADLCFRLRHRSRAILVDPRATCRHFEPPTASEPESLAFHKYKNLIALYFLHARASVLPAFALRYGVLALGRALAHPADRAVLLRSWGWALARLPRLLAERVGLVSLPPIEPPDDSDSGVDRAATTPLDLMACALRGDLAWTRDGAWDAHVLAAAADHHGVGPLVWHALQAAQDCPQSLCETLAPARHVALAREMLAERELRRVLDALEQRGIPVLVTKGAALAYSLYPDPWLRPRLDTDLLVAREFVAAADRVLGDLGYRAMPGVSTGEFISHQAPYEHRDSHGVSHVVDLHWKAVNPAMLADVLSFELLWQDAIEVRRPGLRARIPSHAGSLLLACLHRLAHHQQQERLVWLYDIHLLAGALDGAGWSRACAVARARGIAAICGHGLDAAAARLGTPVPAEVRATLAAAAGEEASRTYTERRQSRRTVLMADLRLLPRWRDRLRLLGEHAFPPASFMMARYDAGRRAWLPFLYAHRLAAGAWRWIRG